MLRSWKIKATSFLFLMALSACSQGGKNPWGNHPLPLDMGSAEYRQALENPPLRRLIEGRGLSTTRTLSFSEADVANLQAALAMGERLLKWIDHMNSFRSEENKIRLTTKAGGLRGIPIDAPKSYSPRSVSEAHLLNVNSLDALSRRVLIDNESFTENPALSDEDFVLIARKIDSNYQTSARWQMMSPWLSYYAARFPQDVRGYYFLTRTPNIENVLASFSSLSPEDQERFSFYLKGLCLNSKTSAAACDTDLANHKSRNTLGAFYAKFYESGRSNWQTFFDVQNARRDIQWSRANPFQARIPFRRHSNHTYTNFVVSNVENEFQWQGFKLLFDLRPNNASGIFPFVVFEAGATPHVNGLGGNKIVMDANSPLTEWDVQWTIRHEFGHVVGLPDCYFEFYDTSVQEMVNYQLDTTDLMCSRAGRMNQRIFDELKRVYF